MNYPSWLIKLIKVCKILYSWLFPKKPKDNNTHQLVPDKNGNYHEQTNSIKKSKWLAIRIRQGALWIILILLVFTLIKDIIIPLLILVILIIVIQKLILKSKK